MIQKINFLVRDKLKKRLKTKYSKIRFEPKVKKMCVCCLTGLNKKNPPTLLDILRYSVSLGHKDGHWEELCA